MSEPFFNSEMRIAKLQDVAESWLKTPFVANGEIKGVGVSCQKLVGCILKECGHLPEDLLLPNGTMNHSTVHKHSLMEAFFSTCDRFAEVKEKPKAGDVIGILWGACVHHLGIMVTGDKFIHNAIRLRYGAMYSTVRDPSYSQLIKKVWRPVQ